MKFGKSGTMIDFFYFLCIFLVLGMVILISVFIWDKISPLLTVFFGAGQATTILQSTKWVWTTMDYLFMALFFMMCGLPILFATMVRNNPAFLVLNIILLVIYFLIAPQISNVMLKFWSMPEFVVYGAGGTATVTFPVMMRLFQYMPIITFGLSIILMIAIASKTTGEAEM